MPTYWSTGCRCSNAARAWIDGKPYCLTHARIAKRAIDRAAELEAFLTPPAWLPAGFHAEWRQARRDLAGDEFGSVDERRDDRLIIRLAAIYRIQAIEKACGRA
jgi:hypothetical protein